MVVYGPFIDRCICRTYSFLAHSICLSLQSMSKRELNRLTRLVHFPTSLEDLMFAMTALDDLRIYTLSLTCSANRMSVLERVNSLFTICEAKLTSVLSGGFGYLDAAVVSDVPWTGG